MYIYINISINIPSADGSYEVKLVTKATVYHTGHILWQPPAVYKGRSGKVVKYFIIILAKGQDLQNHWNFR